MRISDWSSDVCSSDLTFSIRKNLGRRPSTKRRKSQSSVPRGSCVLCRLPAVLNDWHGGPPIRTSTSPSLIPVRARNSSTESVRSEEHTSELQSLMRISYAVFCLKKKNTSQHQQHSNTKHL